MTKTKAEHTKGPWAHGENYLSPEHCERIYARDPGPENDFTIGYARDVDLDTRMANARLLSAAPELLEALDGLVAAVNSVYPNHQHELGLTHPLIAANRAIAKARGEGE